ncbi:MAG: hypothetical protein NTX50_29915 [Candidatus Sumerlaeota bacterium]|nr:hypothetical protein [Candidatus Sumerlaeota bacterium]
MSELKGGPALGFIARQAVLDSLGTGCLQAGRKFRFERLALRFI